MDTDEISMNLQRAAAPHLAAFRAEQLELARAELARALAAYRHVVAEVFAGRPGDIAGARAMVEWAERDLARQNNSFAEMN